MGISTSLTWYDIGAILHVIQVANARLVVEIGVEHGGLAALLLAYGAATGVAYRGLDITLAALHPVMHVPALVQRDAWAMATIIEVQQWMAETPGPTLILCDGGDKPKELRLYAPLIRPGDVLMGHDYRNEYGDAAIQDMPPNVRRVRDDWLDKTLLCLWEAA
jgi:cephalosporin hydroxylase